MAGHAYIELQAGLTRTQLECIPMPAKTAWTWTEAFGFLQVDPAKAHSKVWRTAWQAAEASLEAALPRAQLDAIDRELAAVTSQKSDHWLAWLHLGNMRMEALDAKGARAAWETGPRTPALAIEYAC